MAFSNAADWSPLPLGVKPRSVAEMEAAAAATGPPARAPAAITGPVVMKKRREKSVMKLLPRNLRLHRPLTATRMALRGMLIALHDFARRLIMKSRKAFAVAAFLSLALGTIVTPPGAMARGAGGAGGDAGGGKHAGQVEPGHTRHIQRTCHTGQVFSTAMNRCVSAHHKAAHATR